MVLCESVTIFSSSQGTLFPSSCLPYFFPPSISSLILLGLDLNVYMIAIGNKWDLIPWITWVEMWKIN